VDVLIVGAGISGIGAACYLQKRQPRRTYAIVEARGAIGGTWDLFRYPGIRSDSDLYTFGYEFKPWRNEKSIASGDAILEYLRETVEENGIGEHIRFHHTVKRGSWSSERARWTVEVERSDTGKLVSFDCAHLFAAAGYYRYDQGYRPHFQGEECFTGPIVHPQHWPENLDYRSKRVVVIGSGATAVTLLPALARTAAHVTMLQRTPTYIMPLPSRDRIAKFLQKLLPATTAHALIRRKNIVLQRLFFRFCQRFPNRARAFIRATNLEHLPKGYPVDEHFKPPYDPWDQRLCAVPDGDLFAAIRAGTVAIVTDRIETFTERGIRLVSGRALEADIIVTATGLNVQLLGGITLTVDGKPVRAADKLAFKGMMLNGVPNFAFAVGYTNSSWTLKIGLLWEHYCRLLDHMDRHGYAICVPERGDPNMPTRPLLEFGAGYVKRALPDLPRQGPAAPWVMSMDYFLDTKVLREAPVEDPNLRFYATPRAEARQPREERMGSAAVNPQTARAGRIRVRELEFAYDVRGAGEPLVLLPGVTMRRLMWPDALCDMLADRGFLVVRLDNRDAGDSSRVDAAPPEIRAVLLRSIIGLESAVPYRLEDMAEDVFGVMAALGHEQFHVAGASMGGMIAQTMAIMRPSRLRTLTSVMSTPGGRRYSLGRPSALRALLKRPAVGREAQLTQMMSLFRVLHGDELPFDEDAARQLALDGGTSPAAAARQLCAIFDGSMRRLAKLRGVRTPTLVIHGSIDPLLPLRGARAMARIMPKAELLVVRGMGHAFPGCVLPQIADAIAAHARQNEGARRHASSPFRSLPPGAEQRMRPQGDDACISRCG
jgi:cation diffusion facilitator CzcD-associated flavoprotein CzcO/pimeloyl-ACP methyl ester carboxylesterase